VAVFVYDLAVDVAVWLVVPAVVSDVARDGEGGEEPGAGAHVWSALGCGIYSADGACVAVRGLAVGIHFKLVAFMQCQIVVELLLNYIARSIFRLQNA